MRRFIVSGSILLCVSWACVDKKKTVRRTVQPMAQPTELTSSPEINLPSVSEPNPVEPLVETPTPQPVAETTTESAPQATPGSPDLSLDAKPMAVKPVQYENVVGRILAEGSANELKEEGLARIRERALMRAREQEAENKEADLVETPVEEPAETDETFSLAAKTQPTVEAPADTIPMDVSPESKPAGILETQFNQALILVKKGQLDEAKNKFLSICQSGHAHACHKFAWYEEKAGNSHNATRFYDAACESGLGKSCNNLAFQYERKKDYEKAVEHYARGCMDKHEASCESMKRLREKQKNIGIR